MGSIKGIRANRLLWRTDRGEMSDPLLCLSDGPNRSVSQVIIKSQSGYAARAGGALCFLRWGLRRVPKFPSSKAFYQASMRNHRWIGGGVLQPLHRSDSHLAAAAVILILRNFLSFYYHSTDYKLLLNVTFSCGNYKHLPRSWSNKLIVFSKIIAAMLSRRIVCVL